MAFAVCYGTRADSDKRASLARMVRELLHGFPAIARGEGPLVASPSGELVIKVCLLVSSVYDGAQTLPDAPDLAFDDLLR